MIERLSLGRRSEPPNRKVGGLFVTTDRVAYKVETHGPEGGIDAPSSDNTSPSQLA